jgi:hypothetical protein
MERRREGGGMNNNLAVKYSKADKNEMIAAARSYLRSRKIRATARNIEAQIASEHGDAVAAMICKFLGITPTPIAARDGGYNKISRPAKRSTAKKTKNTLKEIFGFKVAAVARTLGAANWLPSDAIVAIHSIEPKASKLAIRTYVQAGRSGVRGNPAALTKAQLKQLTAAVA